mmetsp:Transcript_139004/g.241753  ORF Transcript_139004/g.241753 Transcript_139004/m.241753 type:complete len:306 (-) Transcript_139004:378-1295(-)
MPSEHHLGSRPPFHRPPSGSIAPQEHRGAGRVVGNHSREGVPKVPVAGGREVQAVRVPVSTPLLVGHHRGHVDAQHFVGQGLGPGLQLAVQHEPLGVVLHVLGVDRMPALGDGQRNGHQPLGMARLVQSLQVPPDGIEWTVVAQVVGPGHDDAGGVRVRCKLGPQATGRFTERIRRVTAVHTGDHLVGSPPGHADLLHWHPEPLGQHTGPGGAVGPGPGEEARREAVPAAEKAVRRGGRAGAGAGGRADPRGPCRGQRDGRRCHGRRPGDGHRDHLRAGVRNGGHRGGCRLRGLTALAGGRQAAL